LAATEVGLEGVSSHSFRRSALSRSLLLIERQLSDGGEFLADCHPSPT
jgi:hypothetical protein